MLVVTIADPGGESVVTGDTDSASYCVESEVLVLSSFAVNDGDSDVVVVVDCVCDVLEEARLLG